MKILHNEKEYFKEIILQSKKSKVVYVSTFGLWAGIMADGREIKATNSSLALEHLAHKKTFFVVGKPSYIPCKKGGCKDCLKKHEEQLGRIGTTLRKFHIPFKISDSYHAKYCLFDNGVSLIGGMNFSSSNWTDYMFVSKDKSLRKELLAAFKEAWNSAGQ